MAWLVAHRVSVIFQVVNRLHSGELFYCQR